MAGIKIIDVKVIGFCSKHREENDAIPRHRNGDIVKDDTIECLDCSLPKVTVSPESEKTVLDLYKEELKRVRLSTLEEIKEYGLGYKCLNGCDIKFKTRIEELKQRGKQ